MTTPKLRYQIAASLDGFIAPLDGSTDWLAGYGAGKYDRFIATIGGIIMGRRGFETELTMGDWASTGLAEGATPVRKEGLLF